MAKSYKFKRRNTAAAQELRKKQTPAEKLLWACLKNRGLQVKFRRQFPIADTPYVVDFCCYALKLVIEVDGEIHEQQEVEDVARQEIIEQFGYIFLRFKNEAIYYHIDQVLATIRAKISELSAEN